MRYFLSECKCGKKQITHIRPTRVDCACGRQMKKAIEVDKKLRPIESGQAERSEKKPTKSTKIDNVSIQGELDLI